MSVAKVDVQYAASGYAEPPYALGFVARLCCSGHGWVVQAEVHAIKRKQAHSPSQAVTPGTFSQRCATAALDWRIVRCSQARVRIWKVCKCLHSRLTYACQLCNINLTVLAGSCYGVTVAPQPAYALCHCRCGLFLVVCINL